MESAINKVTVIIPVYNVQDYLARCIDSVLQQSYRELEIILVDDGSTDSSGAICDQYATRDHRISVIHKANGGLSSARNAGLDAMTGQQVTFIDADDAVHPQFVETLLNTMHSTCAQIAVSRWQVLKNDAKPRKVDVATATCRTFSQQEAIMSVFYQHQLNHSACSRLFQASLFKSLRFPEGKLYEDLAIIYPLLRSVDAVALVSAPMYYYYMHRSGSIINTVTLQRTQVLEHLNNIMQQVEQETPQYVPAVRSRLLSASFNMLRIMPPSAPEWQPVKKECWENIQNIRNLCIKDSNVRAKNKAAIIISYFGLPFLMKIINRNR